MRLDAIHVEGYGIFQDLRMGPLGQLVVIVGPNESGKTTLLSFIRSVLFGFPDARSSDNRYPPLLGGRHGGRLVIMDAAGQPYSVERFAGARGGSLAISKPDGTSGDRSTLEALLGNASKDLFRNVFAFSLDELQAFSTLSKEDIWGRIYSAGVGAGRLLLTEAEKALSQRQAALFRRSGNARIAKLFQDLERAETQLREVKALTSRYGDLKRDLEQLEEKTSVTRQAYDEKQQQLRHIQDLSQAWDHWIEYRAAQEDLRALPTVTAFPADGVARLEALLERRRLKHENLQRAENGLRRQQEEQAGLQVDRRIVEVAPEVDRLRRGLDRYESARKDLPGLEAQLTSDSLNFQETLRNLGQVWDETRVMTFDSSIPTREAVRGQKEAQVNARQAMRDAVSNLGVLGSRVRSIQAQSERLERELETMEAAGETDPEAHEKKRRRARELYEALAELNMKQERRRALEERSADAQHRLESLHRQTASSMRNVSLPWWPVIAFLLVAGAAALWLVRAEQVAAGAATIVVSLMLSGLYLYVRQQSPKLAAQRLSLDREETQSVENRLKSIRTELETISGQVERNLKDVNGSAEEFGLTDAVTLQEVRLMETDLEAQSRALAERQMRQATKKEVQHQLEEATREQEEAQQNYEQRAGTLSVMTDQWRSWLRQQGLDENLSPEGCLEVLSALDLAREKLRGIEELRDRVASVKSAIEGFEADVVKVAVGGGFETSEEEPFSQIVDQLASAVKLARENEQRGEQIKSSLAEAEEEAQVLRKSLEEAAGEIEILLKEAEAEDEEAFRARAEIFKKREELGAGIRDCTKNLERIAGAGEALELFIGELQESTPEELRALESKVTDEASGLDAERTALVRSGGDLERQILELEQEERAAELRLQTEVFREQLATAAKEWSVVTIALKLIEATKKLYERERQPAVIQEAQGFFSGITGGKYRRLVSPLGEQRIRVEDLQGRVKDVAHLSRGASEQLYLALRFGLVREFGRRAEPLPVIMDDVLVNFDPGRATEACHAIAELSASHQVLLFTCHPGTAQLLQSAAGQCQLVELPNVA